VFQQLELSRKAISARILAMVGAGGIIASLAAVWYQAHAIGTEKEFQALQKELHIRDTGWETLGGTAIAMTIIAVLIIVIAMFSGTTVTRHFLSAAGLSALLVMGLTIWRWITPPLDYQDPAITSVDRGPGQYLSVAACLLVIAGAVWGLYEPARLKLKRCPDCDVDVPDGAKKCMHCGHQFA
jgi:hypothetical protein